MEHFMKTLLAGFARNESGATAIEYGLIAGLVSVVIVTALLTVGDTLTTTFEQITTALEPAAGTDTTTPDTTTP
jgi:pilus assembly protein Flp/PilA